MSLHYRVKTTLNGNETVMSAVRSRHIDTVQRFYRVMRQSTTCSVCLFIIAKFLPTDRSCQPVSDAFEAGCLRNNERYHWWGGLRFKKIRIFPFGETSKFSNLAFES